MANEEQVKMLLQSVDGWNKWRSQHTYLKIDLSGADLGGADLQKADLSQASYTESFFFRISIFHL